MDHVQYKIKGEGVLAWRHFTAKAGAALPEVGHEADDYCGYCGANNGPDGKYRQGYDCCQCGGN
jgi:hypothetical protein